MNLEDYDIPEMDSKKERVAYVAGYFKGVAVALNKISTMVNEVDDN